MPGCGKRYGIRLLQPTQGRQVWFHNRRGVGLAKRQGRHIGPCSGPGCSLHAIIIANMLACVLCFNAGLLSLVLLDLYHLNGGPLHSGDVLRGICINCIHLHSESVCLVNHNSGSLCPSTCLCCGARRVFAVAPHISGSRDKRSLAP